MKLIELHILQSFPVSCLNRDDVGAPKTAIFGGVTRARISSQCLKRAIRHYLKDPDNGLPHAKFGGIRSKLLVEFLEKELTDKHNLSPAQAGKLARSVAGLINKKDGKSIPDDKVETETLVYFSQNTVEQLAADAAATLSKGAKGKLTKEQAVESIKQAGFYDAADIALFGRMVAAEPSLTLEGAAMFSHALSTHEASPDIDFFSAIDDAKAREEGTGAGMIGTLEYTSAVYYRYAAVNLDLLAKPSHLGQLSGGDRRQVADLLIRATVEAIPTARHNSMNAHTRPAYALGIVRLKGQPLQLVNAFERPVRSRNGLIDESVKKALLHNNNLNATFNLKSALELATGFHRPVADEELKTNMIPKHVDLDTFCKEILRHVA